MQVMKYIGIFMLFIAAAFYGMVFLSPSEIKYTVNEDIQAPIEEVYLAIGTPQTWVKWTEGIVSVKQTKGDSIAQGNTTLVYYPQDMVMTRTVTLAVPYTRLAILGEVSDFFSKSEDVVLKQLDSTTTRISYTVKMNALSMKSRMVLRAEETHKKNTAANISRLKNLLEGNLD